MVKCNRPKGSKHRKIWTAGHGKIPRDERGVSFDIHHKDGDPFNNSLENLEALSVHDHYQRHFKQGDYLAAWLISLRLDLDERDYREIGKRISESQRGRVLSEDWKRKISEALTGRRWTAEQRVNITNSLRGRKYPKEFGEAISKRRKGMKFSEDHRRKLSESHSGNKHSDETKAKMSAAKKGNKQSQEFVARRVESRKLRGGYIMSEETKRKISRNQTGKTIWPNGRSLEDKAKISLGHRRRIDGARMAPSYDLAGDE